MQENQQSESVDDVTPEDASELARVGAACYLVYFGTLSSSATFGAGSSSGLAGYLAIGISIAYCYFSFLVARKRGWSMPMAIVVAGLLSNWVFPLLVAVKDEIRKDGRMNPKALQAIVGIAFFWIASLFIVF